MYYLSGKEMNRRFSFIKPIIYGAAITSRTPQETYDRGTSFHTGP